MTDILANYAWRTGLPLVPFPTAFSLTMALFLVCYTVISLGYTIAISKSILIPASVVPFLGFLVDSPKQAFTLLPRKKAKFIALVRTVLAQSTVEVTTLQKLAGKCTSFSLAVPGARLFTDEIDLAISIEIRRSRPLKVSGLLRLEVAEWIFSETWSGFLPWRSEKHHHIEHFSDASSFAWGGVLSPGKLSLTMSDSRGAYFGVKSRIGMTVGHPRKLA